MVLLANENIDRLCETASVLIGFFKLFSSIQDIVFFSLVLVDSPDLNVWIVLRLNSAIRVVLVDEDQLSAVLVELFDLFKRRIDRCLQGPIYVHHSTEPTQFHNRFGQICLRFNVDDQSPIG